MRNSKFSKSTESSGTAIAETMREAKPAVSAPVKAYGPRQMGDSILFIAAFPQAKAVSLVGDFNNWKPEKNPMTKTGDDWQTKIRLPKGTYQYRFVVDGLWQHDPANNMTQPNPYGGLNSVLKVS
ncbi:MAG: isoamylase early set domain-containing protein [Sedimentisphaerales bacterium]